MTHTLIDAKEIKKALAWLSKYWNRPVHPEYHAAGTINEAISLLDKYGEGAKLVAGGIDVIGLMKDKVISPGCLINIKSITGLNYINENENGMAIGALTGINDIERSSLVRSKYPALFEAARSIASPQIRNMATIGGNICQDVRCWYYRRSPVTGAEFPCRRKNEGGICYAPDGENQYHSIIGGNKCFAVCPSDMATVLSALHAEIKTVDVTGGRIIPINDFYTIDGNILGPDEIITSIQIPELSAGTKQCFLKYRLRKATDFAIISVTVVMSLRNNYVDNVSIVIGGVAPVPHRAVRSEEILKGEMLTEHLIERVAEISITGAMPLSKNSYKIPIVKTYVRRALQQHIDA